MDRTCPECGAGFTVDSVTSRRKYCPTACREKGCAHLPEQRVCPQCDKEFTTDVSRKRKFCSAECLAAFRCSKEQQEARLCPYCQQPITIVALLATAEVARSTMPHHRTDVVPLRRIP